MRLGIDVGSTTVKLVLLDEKDEIIYSRYERHMSNVFEKVTELLNGLYNEVGNIEVTAVITGSGGLSLAELLELKFEQEVIACSEAVQRIIPETEIVIELGGEDAKITFYGATIEQRMNGTCAGGTGAFIDQMAVLLNTDANGLNEVAKNYSIIYPIAARCGVFAKTDLQPLINDGAAHEDLAVSIFQAVVNQTISGLACGHTIKGNVAFLGGPLTFLSELRKRFIETLKLTDEEVIFPNDSKYFVAIGAAFLSEKVESKKLEDVINTVKNADRSLLCVSKYLDPLFSSEEEYRKFKERHDKAKIKRADLSKVKGPVFLGIDAGSTTTKAALIDENKNLLFEYYSGNKGDPLGIVKKILTELYSKMPDKAYIGKAVVTGYGESLVKTAYRLDKGEIETMAHYKAAEEFLPGVNFILDIGGQDMKCMRIKNGAIYNIMLNEACSSGCGSFIETYAKSVDMEPAEFAEEALNSKNPVDLGTRCTVFMNSRVKQSQKEGATIGDISAGLSYSVIKNALYKVIKLRNPEETGEKVVVQGGTFLNEAVLRSIENILGKEVIRPDISGIMGAYGAAIIGRNEHKSGEKSEILTVSELDDFKVKTSNGRCHGCENNCILTISKFADGSRYVSGNRCEVGAGGVKSNKKAPNLYEYKYKKIFDRKSLVGEDAVRGQIGIPRVLNMFENYPFWHEFFTKLGFEVVLSPSSSKDIYEMGMESIPSDTACYPAKIVHGHIKWLVNQGQKRIFYPCINYENNEDPSAPNHYNCPIVATYPEAIDKNMMELLETNNVEYYHPFVPFDNDEKMVEEFYKFFNGKREIDIDGIDKVSKAYGYDTDAKKYSLFTQNISKKEIKEAIKAGRNEYKEFKTDLQNKGKEVLDYIEKNNMKAVVLSGRPYHVDPEINHGIDNLITSFDMAVLTEDSIIDETNLDRPIRVLDQWVYHSRLYKAAKFVCSREDVELIQLNSFGCGLDAVTTDQVEEILSANNKLYTVLKIDEGSNLGAAKIRIRSLKAAMEERSNSGIVTSNIHTNYERKIFTKEMKKDYTLLIPQMSPIHFQYFVPIMESEGYNVELLPAASKNSEEEGLRYINNDACYPTIVTLGQMIDALKSGKYDLDKVALFMSQTGGGCRASNYVSLLRKALKDLGMEQVPVISFNAGGLETNPGFKISTKMGIRLVYAVLYGDLFMKCLYKTRPYEEVVGSANAIHDGWYDKIVENVMDMNPKKFRKNIKKIVNDFDEIPLKDIKKPKVGVVGEILVKYHPNANDFIVERIEEEGGEAIVPDFLDFFMYGMYSKKFNYESLSGTYKAMLKNWLGIQAVGFYRRPVRKALRNSKRFTEGSKISDIAEKASNILSLGNQCGEGWLLTGEMVELLDSDVKNILCLQPFACLPNHVTGKGMIKGLRNYDEDANIVAIDYDPGASNVNQLNRIKLMMANAFKNME
ncbi:MAG: 2-hydroxyacyl-CoA dehydratase [Peptostreptococcaceae bacterium]|nr:2-hydroxyacyl-CoA dehydratase [Peptostreptococcaceae bacterium]